MPDPQTPPPAEQEQIKAAVAGDATADPNEPPQDPLAPPEGTAPGLSPDPTQPPAPEMPPAPGQPEPPPQPDADPMAPPPGAPPQDPLAPGAPPGPEPSTQGLPELPSVEAPTKLPGPSVEGMQPSLMEEPGAAPETPAQGEEAPAPPAPEPGAETYAPPAEAPAQEGYYDPYSGGGGEAMSEVAEQIVAEKLAPIRRAVEDTLDHRTTVEAKLVHLNDRLKRIENIIDELQMSILQKVGEYVANVSDLKKEVIETQKSFKSMHKRNRKK